jgi:microcystin-dependent protein
MSNQYLGEIRMFAGNFAPFSWAFCNGQLIPIQQNTALFSLLGTTFGGDGVRTFGLPDLRGRLPVGQGSGPGLSTYTLGEIGGEENVTIALSTMPSHSHQLVSTAAPTSDVPTNAVLGTPASGVSLYAPAAPSGTLNPSANGSSGGGQSHTNVMPYLCTSFIIALTGVFPARN